MGTKINGVDPPNFVGKMGVKSTQPIKKHEIHTADTFEFRAERPLSPFLRVQNALQNETVLDISYTDMNVAAPWWTDELASLAPEYISEKHHIKPHIADTLRALASEKNYLLVNLADVME